MHDKIENFIIDNNKSVSWNSNQKIIKLSFALPLFQVQLIQNLEQVLVLADYKETGERNLFIYNHDGTLAANPAMPNYYSAIAGAYSVWYIDGSIEQTVVLIAPKEGGYDVKCTFNLIDHSFSDLSLTK